MKRKTSLTILIAAALILATAIPSFAAMTQSEISEAAPQAPTADAAVSVAHLAPFAAGVDNTSVSIYLNGSEAIPNFKFGDIANVNLAPGDYLVEVIPTGTMTVAISGTVSLAADTSYTLAAIGDGVNQPLELYPLVDDITALVSGAKLRVSHLAPFAASGTEVDICTDDGTPIPGLQGVPYKVTTDPYLELPAGDYDLKITLAGSACATTALDLPSLRLADGDIVDVIAIGGANGYDLEITSTTGFTLTPAMVSVAHLAPFAAGLSNTSVSVKLNGTEAITDFEFGDIVNTELAPGDYLVEIIPTGTSTVAISGIVTLDPAGDYTLTAIGDGANQPLELMPFVDDNISPINGAKLRVAHLAPFAASGTEVDICTDDGTPIPGLQGVPYKGFTDPYLELPANDYNLKITVAGTSCATTALDLPSLRLAQGDIVDVFAIGGANGYDLSVASVTGFSLTPAKVSVAHLAPFASGLNNTSVTVRLNGADALNGFLFGDFVDVELEPGDYLVEVLPSGTSTVAISDTVTLDPAGDYTLAAIGDGVNQPLELFPLVDDNTPATTGAKLRVVHLAPFASSGTEVDICTEADVVVPGLNGVPFKGYTADYLELPAGVLDVKVTAAGSSCATMIFDIPPVDLQEGYNYSVFAIGGANDFAPTATLNRDLPYYVVMMPMVHR